MSWTFHPCCHADGQTVAEVGKLAAGIGLQGQPLLIRGVPGQREAAPVMQAGGFFQDVPMAQVSREQPC